MNGIIVATRVYAKYTHTRLACVGHERNGDVRTCTLCLICIYNYVSHSIRNVNNVARCRIGIQGLTVITLYAARAKLYPTVRFDGLT